MYSEDSYLMLSGIQHFYFCKRQWALIHIEQQWQENIHTSEGNILHKKVDDPFIKEKRKDIIISRSVPISSSKLGLSGVIDLVEFRKNDTGVKIEGKSGYWMPRIVEYKKGKPKRDKRDIVQVVAQNICLEDYYDYKIDYAELYYFSVNKREEVHIDDDLRKKVFELSEEMHEMYEQSITPKAEYFKNCTLCSLYDLCMPRLTKKKKSVQNYIYGD